jgi:KipI family sensor histidine kinase inhibitor
LVWYDPLIFDLSLFLEEVRETERGIDQVNWGKVKTVKIPIAYGKEFGPDLEFVAQYHHLSVEEVIHLHGKPVYTNCMYGFDPGYILLLGLPRRLETPRLENPRLNIPAGTVGIGGAQTGIYPSDRSGGWQLIGKIPLKMFDLHREPPILVDIGDKVKFYRINREEYEQILSRVEHHEDPLSAYIQS